VQWAGGSERSSLGSETAKGNMREAPLVAIVDDDTSIRNATQDLLKSAGFSTAAFEDAESFLGSASRARAACVIADMRMRGMSGFELYRQLVASGHAIPTVIVTAHPEDLTHARAREAGIDCLLIKPVAPDELLDCVHEAIAKPRTSRAIPKS
jgi:FixJ family two-component response regulator